MDSTLKTVSGDFNSGTIFKPVTGKENPIEVIASIKKAYASMGRSPDISTVIFIAALGALALDDCLDRILDPDYPTNHSDDCEPENYYVDSSDYERKSSDKVGKQIPPYVFLTLYYSIRTHYSNLRKLITTYKKEDNFSIIETRLEHATVHMQLLYDLYLTTELSEDL